MSDEGTRKIKRHCRFLLVGSGLFRCPRIYVRAKETQASLMFATTCTG